MPDKVLKKIPKTIVFIIIIFAGGIGITVGFQIVFETLDIPYNENMAENRIKRFTEPLEWMKDRFSNPP